MIGAYRREYCEKHGLVVLEENRSEVLVGYWKPDAPALRDTLSALHGKRVRFTPVEPTNPAVRIVLEALEDHRSEETTDRAAAEDSGSDPGERLLRSVLGAAVRVGAGDLSLWRVSAFQWQVAMRVRGVFIPVGRLPDRSARVLVRRIKARAELDLFETEREQSGRVEFSWLPEHTVRVATLGDRYQEALALRFLDRRPIPLLALGFTRPQILQILTALETDQGLVVFCGPTGSGKTTSAASVLALIAANRRKVVSLEDPVEYRVEGVLQLEEQPRIPQEDRLAALLRQDPDVIWLGEVRRPGSARILQEAVLTGHLVFVTVHCSGLTMLSRRLESLGFDPAILPDILVLACAQRLVGSPPRLSAQLSTEVPG